MPGMRMSGWAVASWHTLCRQPPPVLLPESGPQDRRGRQEMRGMPGREWEGVRKLGGRGVSALLPGSSFSQIFLFRAVLLKEGEV